MYKNIYILFSSINTWKRFAFCFLFLLFLGSFSVYSQSNPTPFNLSGGNYSFTTWAATSTAGTYPANMYFHITSTQDPGLAVATTGNYTGAYSGSGTIIGGLGTSGFYFYNTGTSGYLGAAVLALNTTGRTNNQVSWTGGTYATGGGSVYAIRLQYRVTITGTWTDIPGPIEYVSTTGTSQSFGPTTLPSTCDNNAVVQLRWKYYNISTGGIRPKLSLGSISVTSSAMLSPPTVQASNIVFSNVTTTSFKISCTKGNGAKRLILIKAGSAVNTNPSNNNCDTANTVFGSGTQLGTGNFTIYSDTGNSCTVTGLAASTNYYVAIYEFNGTCPGSLVSYLTPTTASSSQQTNAIPTPGINISSSTLPDYGSTIINSGLGNIQSFTVSGTSLTNNITITPPSGFDISLSNSPFSITNPITLTKDGSGTIAVTTVYVRFSPTIVKSYSDSISIVSSGATSKYIKLTGKGIKAAPTNHVTNIQATLVTPFSSSINVSWIDATGTIIPDGYLINGSNVSYAAITNPTDGALPDSSVLIKERIPGIQYATFTGLNASTTYYFKIFPYSNTGTDTKYKTDGTIPEISINTIASGTIVAPLTCNQAILNNTGTSIWAYGYIVGSAYSAISVEFDSTSIFQYDTNIALADSMDETNISNMLFVKLSNNFLRPVLNLLDNHGNYHKQVEVKGDLMAYYTPHAGMQNTVDFKWFNSPVSILTGSYNNAYTWSTGIPGSNDNVTINSNVFVDTASICNKISISTIGELTIELGNTLSIIDTMTIESGGSLIDYNSQTINAVVKRNFTSANWANGLDGWRSISSPVNNQTITGNWTNGNYDFYSYDEPSNQWLNQKVIANNINTFTVGNGYFSAYQTDTNKYYNGILNYDNVLVNLSYTPTGGKGYNLLGNPYPSAIEWNNDGTNNWSLTNVESIAKIWNECNQTYSQIFNNDIIPSNQGFFVKAVAPVTGFIIPNTARVHNSHTYYKSLNSNMLTFNVSNYQNECKVSAYILFNPLATFGYDLSYESSELQGSSIAPRLYSLLSTGEKLSVNALPVITSNTIVNVGFVAGVNGLYTIQLDSNNVTTFISIILKDIKADSSQDLLLNPIYNFTADTIDNPNRFELALNITSTTGINSEQVNYIKVAVIDKMININSKEIINQVEVYNILGQKLYSNLTNNSCELNINFKDKATGVYIIKAYSNKDSFIRKILIQ